MPFFKKITTPEGLIGLWKITETPEILSSEIRLSAAEQERLLSIRSVSRKTEFLATRALLQHLAPAAPEIKYLESGKPFLPGGPHISISHSADFAALMLSSSPIGIDIEQNKRNINRLMPRFLHPDEIEFIHQSPHHHSLPIIYWCAKEAIFKHTDHQGIQFNEQIRIEPAGAHLSNEFKGKLTINEKTIFYQLISWCIENNTLVICVEKGAKTNEQQLQ